MMNSDADYHLLIKRYIESTDIFFRYMDDYKKYNCIQDIQDIHNVHKRIITLQLMSQYDIINKINDILSKIEDMNNYENNYSTIARRNLHNCVTATINHLI